jgi:DHA1 family bicyclomycin/chloramphenicol resistance-like MFS transporter
LKTFDNAGIAALLALTTVATVMGIDGTLAAMPAITAAFGVSREDTQLTLSLFMIGIAVGQLFHGPLSDRVGRRPAILAGILLNVAATVACATATSIEMLMAARFVHGFAAATGWIVSRAVVRDRFERAQSARVISVMMFFHAFAPLTSPILGAELTAHFGWQAMFVFIAVYNAGVAALYFAVFRETIPARNPHALRIAPMLRSFAEISRSVPFWGYTACSAAAYGFLFSFLGASSHVIITGFGESERAYGIMFAACMTGSMSGTFLGARLVTRWGPDPLLRFGMALAVCGGIAMAVLSWAGVREAWAVFAPMFFCLTAFALIFPQSVAGALQPFPHIAGAASSFIGFVQQIVGAATGVVVASLSAGTQAAIAYGILFWTLFGLGAYWAVVRRHRTM